MQAKNENALKDLFGKTFEKKTPKSLLKTNEVNLEDNTDDSDLSHENSNEDNFFVPVIIKPKTRNQAGNDKKKKSAKRQENPTSTSNHEQAPLNQNNHVPRSLHLCTKPPSSNNAASISLNSAVFNRNPEDYYNTPAKMELIQEKKTQEQEVKNVQKKATVLMLHPIEAPETSATPSQTVTQAPQVEVPAPSKNIATSHTTQVKQYPQNDKNPNIKINGKKLVYAKKPKVNGPDSLKAPGNFSLMYANTNFPLKDAEKKIITTLNQISTMRDNVIQKTSTDIFIDMLALRYLVIVLFNEMNIWLNIYKKTQHIDEKLLATMEGFQTVLPRCFDNADISDNKLLAFTGVILSQREKACAYDSQTYLTFCKEIRLTPGIQHIIRRHAFLNQNLPLRYNRPEEKFYPPLLKMRRYLDHIQQLDKMIDAPDFKQNSQYMPALEFCIHEISLVYSQSSHLQNLIKGEKKLAPVAKILDSLSENHRRSKYGFSIRNVIGSEKNAHMVMKKFMDSGLLVSVNGWINHSKNSSLAQQTPTAYKLF